MKWEGGGGGGGEGRSRSNGRRKEEERELEGIIRNYESLGLIDWVVCGGGK